ncbi:hypothetical protein Xentx_03337 [Xenorhabdus thuongxuanensis]|uniref:Uncharacterized protein n=1 Tax=Xenorhabdus thuongxuanensis TaxID=1873484 RepID=A0A1Q5TNH9_9GAMM|nr:hypothetical protein Xentx_03337 [Xenorhabdus thuongxuanensis]
MTLQTETVLHLCKYLFSEVTTQVVTMLRTFHSTRCYSHIFLLPLILQPIEDTLTAHSPPVSSIQTSHRLYRYGSLPSDQNDSDDVRYLHNTRQRADLYGEAE